MMGALSSTYIKLTTAISWTDVSGKQILLQDQLNTIFPKLLPLLVVFGVYLYIKKFGPKYVRILISLLVISVVLSFFGIV
ncbi:TPA: PTS system mannose/fructose/sorbose family transporter subunit IID, partial [Escherichia coli]